MKKLRASGVFERTPRTSESGLVDLKFRFGQTTRGHSATGVGYLLDTPLRFKKLVDLSAQGNIFPADNLSDDHFESERSVTDPSVEIVWVNSVRAGNDNSRLMDETFRSEDNKV